MLAQENKEKKTELTNVKKSMEKHFSNQPFLSPKAFGNLFPFHVIFDKNMYIKQCGTAIARLVPQMKHENCKLTDIFTIIRPHINLEFHSIRSQIMSVFVLCTRSGIMSPLSSSSSPRKSTAANLATVVSSSQPEDTGTRFKGQMVYMHDKDLILFQCSPSVMSLDDLIKWVAFFLLVRLCNFQSFIDLN